MKIDIQNLQRNFAVNRVNEKAGLDFDLKLTSKSLGSVETNKELITSKVLCTPGCGKTGTGNSFCCTC